MSNSSRSAAERQASLLSCDSSRPQNRNDGSGQIRRSPKMQGAEAEMTQAKERQSITKTERTDRRRGGLRHHETQTSSSYASSEKRHTKNRQDRLEAARRTIGGLYRLCSGGQQGREMRDSKTVCGKIHSFRRPVGCIGTQTHAEGKASCRSTYSL